MIYAVKVIFLINQLFFKAKSLMFFMGLHLNFLYCEIYLSFPGFVLFTTFQNFSLLSKLKDFIISLEKFEFHLLLRESYLTKFAAFLKKFSFYFSIFRYNFLRSSLFLLTWLLVPDKFSCFFLLEERRYILL